MAEFTLNYTGAEINERLSKIDSIDTSVQTAQNAANSAEAHSENAYNYASYAQEAAFNVADAMAIPDYVQTEARRVAKNVHEHQGVNTITFLACSDIHYSTVNNVGQMTETLTHMGQAMKIIRENVAIDFAVCLGDSIWDGSNESVEDTQEAMRRVNSALFDAFNGIPNFRLVGNHEAHYKGSTKLTEAQIFTNTAAFNAGATFDESNRIGGYCYRDFPDCKLRVVCLNTSEGDETGGYTTSDAQRTWLANALNVESGWKSIVLSHIPLDWYGANSAPLSVVNAASGVICNVHGHIHNYLAGLMAGSTIPRLGIPNGCFYRANEYGENGTTEYNGMEFGEDTTYNKVAGTANDTAFCVVTIDFDNEVIYADRYGAGYDRVMTFDGVVSSPTYSVTYALTNVTSKTNVVEVTAGGAYTNDLTAENGYEISSVTVTMGGVDITSSAYDNGLISINTVTGNIVITATAVQASPTAYSVTNNLTNATTSNNAASVESGASYSATITASDGYELSSVTVTMGGTNVTSSVYSNGVITIGSVTGNVIITATAVESGPSYTNQVPISLASGGGSVYNGTGYKENYRLNSSGVEASLAGAVHTGFIPYNGQVIRAWGCTAAAGNSGNYLCFYDSSFTKINVLGFSGMVSTGATYTTENGKYLFTADPSAITNATIVDNMNSAAYIRVSFAAGSGADFIVTLDEEIV